MSGNPAEGNACAVCGATEARLWRTATDNLRGGTETFRAVRCVRCGLIRLHPRPSPAEMGRYYASGTYARAEGDLEAGGVGQRLDATFAGQAERVTALYGKTPGRLLDVGCGDGRFLAAMAARGWRTEGVETDSVAAHLARQRSKSVIHETPLEAAQFPDNSFDMVSLLHVLEHVPDPRATLTEAHRILRPGGALFLAVPNAGSGEAALFGGAWYALDLPRHFWGFTPSTLSRLAEECGFAAPTLRYFPLFYAFQNVRNVARRMLRRGGGQDAPVAARPEGGGARTRLFYGLLTLSERLGRTFPGEVMELTATKSPS